MIIMINKEGIIILQNILINKCKEYFLMLLYYSHQNTIEIKK